MAWLLCGLAGALLCGCASLPAPTEAPRDEAMAASPATALGRAAALLAAPPVAAAPGRTRLSAVRPLIQGAFALDARLTLIRRAQRSIDLQTYLIGNDATGLLILRELRDAARRGVRVRLLVDDFYTGGLDHALQGLQAEPGVQVRLFNPFAGGREPKAARWMAFFADFHRLTHRMHNKLFIADGAIGIAGGRNLADEYFLRSRLANFIDFELLMAGPVVAQSAAIFDTYWNSPVVYPLRQIAAAPQADDALQRDFEARTAAAASQAPAAPAENDVYGDPPLGTQLDQAQPHWIQAPAEAFADRPTKGLGDPPDGDTLARRYFAMLDTARTQAILVSPYFIPGESGMAHIRDARARGVRMAVVTNSLADSDEPLVNIQYNRYRVELLQLGVELRELSTRQLKLNGQLRSLLRQARGRLHAKLALLDRRWVLLGSMNIDPRSEHINTEFGVRVDSFELAHAMIDGYLLDDDTEGVYRVVLNPGQDGVRWIGTGDVSNEELDDEPDASLLSRLQLLLFSWFVPTDQL